MGTGERVVFPGGLEAEIIARGDYGERTLRFHTDGDLYQEFERIGHVPLPPYIHRHDTAMDRDRYQTVFARERGSVAAPTAGLHFTPEILDRCRARGATVANITLHVGLGTFQPIHTSRIEGHRLHSEWFHVPAESAALIRSARRTICVGTTSVRVVESAMRGIEGETGIFIYPGFEFRGTGAILTNFHLPRSSLLLLVAAFAGRELTLDAYRHAVNEKYRFYSYGDCMLIV
jgi:S-adenosylmethionine:tRNA ribosyltransferase-isomerase